MKEINELFREKELYMTKQIQNLQLYFVKIRKINFILIRK